MGRPGIHRYCECEISPIEKSRANRLLSVIRGGSVRLLEKAIEEVPIKGVFHATCDELCAGVGPRAGLGGRGQTNMRSIRPMQRLIFGSNISG